MSNLPKYFWILLLLIYIISPLDAHPLFLDDLIAAAMLLYYLYKKGRKPDWQQQGKDHYGSSRSTGQSRQGSSGTGPDPLTLDSAYRLLDITPRATWEEISRAYREKMSKSHPDKVSHLSEELQVRAKELTLRLNEAYDLIKRHRNM